MLPNVNSHLLFLFISNSIPTNSTFLALLIAAKSTSARAQDVQRCPQESETEETFKSGLRVTTGSERVLNKGKSMT